MQDNKKQSSEEQQSLNDLETTKSSEPEVSPSVPESGTEGETQTVGNTDLEEKAKPDEQTENSVKAESNDPSEHQTDDAEASSEVQKSGILQKIFHGKLSKLSLRALYIIGALVIILIIVMGVGLGSYLSKGRHTPVEKRVGSLGQRLQAGKSGGSSNQTLSGGGKGVTTNKGDSAFNEPLPDTDTGPPVDNTGSNSEPSSPEDPANKEGETSGQQEDAPGANSLSDGQSSVQSALPLIVDSRTLDRELAKRFTAGKAKLEGVATFRGDGFIQNEDADSDSTAFRMGNIVSHFVSGKFFVFRESDGKFMKCELAMNMDNMLAQLLVENQDTGARSSAELVLENYKDGGVWRYSGHGLFQGEQGEMYNLFWQPITRESGFIVATMLGLQSRQSSSSIYMVYGFNKDAALTIMKNLAREKIIQNQSGKDAFDMSFTGTVNSSKEDVLPQLPNKYQERYGYFSSLAFAYSNRSKEEYSGSVFRQGPSGPVSLMLEDRNGQQCIAYLRAVDEMNMARVFSGPLKCSDAQEYRVQCREILKDTEFGVKQFVGVCQSSPEGEQHDFMIRYGEVANTAFPKLYSDISRDVN